MDALTQAKYDTLIEQGVVLPKVASTQIIEETFNQHLEQWKRDDLSKMSSKELMKEVKTLESFIERYPNPLNASFHGIFLSAYKEVLAARVKK